MKVSTKGHYGLHAMVELAQFYGKGPALMKDLAAKHGYSEKYLEQLMRDLKRRGLVESSRGVHGGYWLARPPEEISMLEIIEALEGDLLERPSGCSVKCLEVDECATLEIWFKGLEEFRSLLQARTLKDHILRQDELNKQTSAKCSFHKKKG